MMRIGVLMGLGLAATVCGAGQACAQNAQFGQFGQYAQLGQFARPSDPCSQSATSGNPVVALIGVFGQHRRDQECAEERRAQWDEYNARQKAAKDAAALAASSAIVPPAEAGSGKPAAPHEPVVAQAKIQARAQRQHAAADARSKARLERLAEVERDKTAQLRQRQTALALMRAENAPDNHCREADVARRMITAWNGLDTMRAAGMKTVDIEHLTTVSFDAQNRAVACHGVFVTSQGLRFVGTATVKTNVAGDPAFVWQRDQNQDLAAYAAPGTNADTPASASSAREQPASDTAGPGAGPPILSAPATLALVAVPEH
jgi:hypothetical protein